MKTNVRLVLLGLGAGLLGTLLPIAVSSVLFLLAQPTDDVLTLLWEAKLQWLPIALMFGVQAGMYVALRKGVRQTLHVRAGGVTTATGGGASTLAMIACCAPAGINLLLPLLGVTALGSLLATWRMPFMIANVVIGGVGMSVMFYAFFKQRRAGKPTQSSYTQSAITSGELA